MDRTTRWLTALGNEEWERLHYCQPADAVGGPGGGEADPGHPDEVRRAVPRSGSQ